MGLKDPYFVRYVVQLISSSHLLYTPDGEIEAFSDPVSAEAVVNC